MKFRLQFSFRTLVILVVIVAALASWPAARYARYRGRVAAKAELATYGIELIKQSEDEHLEDPNAQPPKPPLTFAERWDQYWFGEEALQKYGSVFIDDQKLLPAYEAQPQFDFHEKLRLFPEVDYLSVGETSRFSDSHYGLPPNMAETRLLPRSLMRAILALPQLTELQILRPGRIDAEVAAVFPHDSPLIRLNLSETTLTPEAWRTILARAPRLRQVSIDQHAFDSAIVADLNRTGWPRAGSETTHENYAQAYIWVDIFDLRPASMPALEPSLVELRIAYKLGISSLLMTKHDPQAAPLVLDGYQAQTINCKNTGNLRLQHFPNLKQSMMARCQNVELQNCPLLQRAIVEHARRLQFEQLPSLDQLIVDESDEFEIRDCPTLERFLLDRVGHAQISNLPNLNHLDMQGESIELSDVPKLDSVTLIQPTLEQLQTLHKQQSSLKYLALEFAKPWPNAKPLPDLPATTLAVLQEFPLLEALQIRGRFHKHVDTVEFFRPLSKLPRLKVLWIDDHQKLPEWLAEDSGEEFLPPNLELLLTDESFANEEQRAAVLQKLPDLLYVVRRDTLEKKLDTRLSELKDLPAKDALVPYAERLEQASPASEP